MECGSVIVHDRVIERHPELSKADVVAAWMSRLRCQKRIGPWPPQYVAIGFDRNGRSIEMVAVYDPAADETLIFHAKVPATKKIMHELGFE